MAGFAVQSKTREGGKTEEELGDWEPESNWDIELERLMSEVTDGAFFDSNP